MPTPPDSNKALARIRAIVPQTVAVGSRVTCNPPPNGTDADYLVYVLDDQEKSLWDAINDDGWVVGGSTISDDVNTVPMQDRFYAYRLADVNLIITKSQSFYHRFLAASSIAKRFNLLKKADRIALFQAVLYGRIDAEMLPVAQEDEIGF